MVFKHHSQGEKPMNHVHSTTEPRKGKHLSFEERVIIQTHLKNGWTPNRIADEVGCASNIVGNEIKLGPSLFTGEMFSDTKSRSGRQLTRRIVKLAAATMTAMKRTSSSLMSKRIYLRITGHWMFAPTGL